MYLGTSTVNCLSDSCILITISHDVKKKKKSVFHQSPPIAQWLPTSQTLPFSVEEMQNNNREVNEI